MTYESFFELLDRHARGLVIFENLLELSGIIGRS